MGAGSLNSGRAQGAPAASVEFGELGFDVDGDDAEEIDVLAVGRGDVGQQLIRHIPAAGAQVLTASW
ncbi:hypothetical protein [Nonomuraea jabiensis]|uniref:hypothetical protein n=1 Tax=Nonomuraea jabiensis TaxID=882448 RepID=UPI00367C6D58